MNVKEVIETCVNYIEKNIRTKITLDDLSIFTGISKFHLHRMFKSLTDETLIDYILSRKLTCSIHELVNTNMRIIDIAYEYGFEYEQSYIRAFRKKFGFTPLKVRNENTPLILKEKININHFMSLNNSVVYKPFFMFRQKFYLIGKKNLILSKSGEKTANLLGKKFFFEQKNTINNQINPHIYFGYTDWSNDGYIYYIPSIEVDNLSNIPNDMVGLTIPTHKYVVFRFVGFFSYDEINGRQLGRLLVHMYSKWIFNSGYKFADTFRFEYIDTSLSKDNYCELDIYQPIVSSE